MKKTSMPKNFGNGGHNLTARTIVFIAKTVVLPMNAAGYT